MIRLRLQAALAFFTLSLTSAEAQPATTQLTPHQTQQRAAGTFQGLSKFRLPQVPLDSQFYVVAQFCDQYGPAVRLANGSVYRLEKTSTSCSGNQIDAPSPNPGERVPKINVAPKPRAIRSGFGMPDSLFVSPAYADTLPSAVSLAAQQTPIKNQGLRNTCTYYATIAGLEAAYKRTYGIDLDLSERHLNARFKMSLLMTGINLPKAEVISSAWDGGVVESILHVMTDQAVGVPPESVQPETAAAETFSTRDVGDDPDIQDSSLVDQRTMDDFNLRDTLLQMKIPDALDIIPLPQQALVQARYRPTSFVLAASEEMKSLDWYRSHIAAGREVIVQFKCCDGFNSIGDVIHNVNGDASHAAVLIGYDDDAQEFKMKNSWGENAFRRFAYDNVTGSSIQTAGVILDVASPLGRFSVRDNPQAFIGRWMLTAGGQAGDLDIYLSPVNPTSKRIGTFFSSQGAAYRVNGFADNGTLRFFIDPAQPNLPDTFLNVGYQFTAYLFDGSRTMMAGDVALPGGTVRGFVARKSQALPTAPVSSRDNLSNPTRVLFGDWRIDSENEIAHLLIKSFSESTGIFEGTYNPENGTPYGAYASLQGDSFVVWTDAPTAEAFRLFSGHFADDQKKIVAGYGNGNGSAYGDYPGLPFVAVLTNEQPVITIPAVSGTLGPPAK